MTAKIESILKIITVFRMQYLNKSKQVYEVADYVRAFENNLGPIVC